MSASHSYRLRSDEFPKFLDNKKQLPADLLDTEAQIWAGKFSYKISTHQIRRFFDEVKRYKQQLENTRVEFAKLKPLIFMLKSKATYATHNKPEMKAFASFIEKSIAEINKGDENEQRQRFMNFCLFFEAVYGFAKLKK